MVVKQLFWINHTIFNIINDIIMNMNTKLDIMKLLRAIVIANDVSVKVNKFMVNGKLANVDELLKVNGTHSFIAEVFV